MPSNKELLKQAINDAVSHKADELANSCTEDVRLNADSINYIALKLNSLIDAAAQLYLSSADIPDDLAEALAKMWDVCSDYIAMYENCSREGTENAPQALYWFDGTDTL